MFRGGVALFCALVVFLGMGLSSPMAGTHQTEDEIPFVVAGVVKVSGNWRLIGDFGDWLEREAQVRLRIINVDNYSQLSEVLRRHPNAIGWTCGRPYVEDHARDGQQLIAVPLFHRQPTYHSLIIARQESDGQALEDFAGKSFAYSDLRSNSSYLAPQSALLHRGIDIQEHFSYLRRTGMHENSIEAVMEGQIEVAAVDEYVWEEWVKTRPEVLDTVRVVETLGPYPFTPIVAGSGVDEPTLQRLRRALLGMADSGQGQEIIQAFGLDGFVQREDHFYDPIRNMIRDVGEGGSLYPPGIVARVSHWLGWGDD